MPVGPQVVDFGDGIQINYIDRQVEVAGEVILREGPLELFAYSKAPAPKEHESIVLVRARPQRVFMALGLIGATPGTTTRWFPDTQTVREASGDPIDVRVRYQAGRRERTVPATDWMLDAAARKPMAATHWIFCGSERSEQGGFGADAEGTLVTVVDFTTSVMALPHRHSDSDEELWLVANSTEIPPIRTKVTLILRPLSTQVTVEIEGEDRFRVDGKTHNRAELRQVLASRTAGWVDRATLRIELSEGGKASKATVAWLTREASDIGIPASQVVKGEGTKENPGDIGGAPARASSGPTR